MDKFIPTFKKSLFCDYFANGMSDITELRIDSVLSDGLLQGIPISSPVPGVARTVKSIQGRSFLETQLSF